MEEVKIVYITNHPSQQRASKKYRENNREIIAQRAKERYNNDKEYREKKKMQMKEYIKKKKELKKMEDQENL